MKKWLIAADFDDTLFHHDGRGILPEDSRAIRQFQKEGNLFGLCTGRCLSVADKEILPSILEAGIDPDFYICSNGTHVADKDKNVFASHILSKETMQSIADACPDINMVIHTDKGVWCGHQPFRQLDNIDDLLKREDVSIYGFTIFREYFDDRGERAASMLAENFPVRAHPNDRTIDWTPLGVDKYTGFGELLAHYDIKEENTAAIGDSYNDLPLIGSLANGFTFRQSAAKVREAVRYSVDSIEEMIQVLRTL